MNGDWTRDGHTVSFVLERYRVGLVWSCPFSAQTFPKDADPATVPGCHLTSDPDAWEDHAYHPEEFPEPRPDVVNFCNVGEYLENDGLEEHVADHVDPPTINPFPIEYQWDGERYTWRPAQDENAAAGKTDA
jgi:hypothetical protein